MKKITQTLILSSLVILSIFAISGCQSGPNKWDKRDPNLPATFYQNQEQLLKTAQEKLTKDPKDFKAQFEVAYRYQMLGRLKDAVAQYEKALSMDAKDFATLNNLSTVYEEVQDYPNAAKYIKSLYVLNPDNSEVLRDTVRVLLANNEPKEAARALENFARIMRDGKKGNQSDFLMISELYQSIDQYNKQHAKK